MFRRLSNSSCSSIDVEVLMLRYEGQILQCWPFFTLFALAITLDFCHTISTVSDSLLEALVDLKCSKPLLMTYCVSC